MANELEINISIENREAIMALAQMTKKTTEFEKSAINSFKQTSQAFEVFKGTLATAAVTKAFDLASSAASAMFDVFKSGVAAAQVQEDAVNRLNAQLQITGQYSEKTSKDLQEFASQLQQTTKFGDEATINMLAFAQAMGASSGQSKEIVKAAADMSAALGIDFEAAVRNVAKTLGGYAGELGEVIPELKNLTQEQLRAGDGIELLAQKFAGAASAQIRTFSGGLQQAKNSFGDLTEVIGSFLTNNELVIAVVNAANKVFVYLQNVIRQNQAAITDFINSGINFLIDSTKSLVTAIDIASKIFVGLQQVFSLVQAGMAALVGVATDAALSILQLAKSAQDFLGVELAPGIDRQIASLERFSAAAKKTASEEIQTIAERENARRGFISALEEIQTKSVDLVKTEVEAHKAATVEIQNENNKKLVSEQEKMSLMAALKEEERLVAEEQKLIEQAAKEEDNTKILEDLRTNQQQQLEIKQQYADKDKVIVEKIRKQREESAKKAEENEKKSLKSLFDFEQNTQAGRAANFKSSLNTISTLQSQSNSTLFNIGKAAAISTATIDGIAAVQKALASAPPPFNFAIAAAVGVATAANLAKISSAKPPAFAQGGFVQGTDFVGDKRLISVNSGEFVANRQQQQNILSAVASGSLSGGSNEDMVNAINNLANRPVIVEIDGREIARATRNATIDGFRVA